MTRFIIPREVNYGWGVLDALKYVEAARALIITDRGIEKLGHVAKVRSILKEKQIEVRVFNEVEADPSRKTVIKVFTLAQEFQPDLFIGLGGGSPIDAGKVAWALYEHPDLATMAWSDALKAVRRRMLRQKARYIAIPCTSGTGSDSTCVAMITDEEVQPPAKTMMISAQMVPDVTMVDAELASTMPSSITADTGFDALSHVIEGYLLTPPSDIIDVLAVGAAQAVFSWLPKAVANGKDVTAREKMHIAATMGGMVISNGRLGLLHDCAHQIGPAFQITHGRAVALMFCPALAYLFPSVSARFGELARRLGLEPANDRDAAEKLIAEVEHLKKQVGMPSSIKETGLDEKGFMAKLDMLAQNTLGGRVGPSGPTLEDIKDLYLKAWEGAKVQLA